MLWNKEVEQVWGRVRTPQPSRGQRQKRTFVLPLAHISLSPESCSRFMALLQWQCQGAGELPERVWATGQAPAPLTSFLRIHDVQGEQHGIGERSGLFLTGEV